MLGSRVLRVMLAVSGLVIAVGLSTNSQIQHTPALRLVAVIPVPWIFWTICFIVYSILLLITTRRAAGYIVGFVLYGFFALAIGLSFQNAHPFNVVTAMAMFDVSIFHIAASRIAFTEGAR